MLYKLGANSGGLTLFVEEGILCCEYNLFMIVRTKIRAKEKLPTGKVRIEIETRYVVPRPGGPLKITIKPCRLRINSTPGRSCSIGRCITARRC